MTKGQQGVAAIESSHSAQGHRMPFRPKQLRSCAKQPLDFWAGTDIRSFPAEYASMQNSLLTFCIEISKAVQPPKATSVSSWEPCASCSTANRTNAFLPASILIAANSEKESSSLPTCRSTQTSAFLHTCLALQHRVMVVTNDSQTLDQCFPCSQPCLGVCMGEQPTMFAGRNEEAPGSFSAIAGSLAGSSSSSSER